MKLAQVVWQRWQDLFDDDSVRDRRSVVAATDARGCGHVAGCVPGQRVRLYGRVRSVVVPGSSGVSFSAEVDDGTGRVRLLFPGRSGADGIDVGVLVEVSGTLDVADGVPVLVQPSYVVDGGPSRVATSWKDVVVARRPEPVSAPTPDAPKARITVGFGRDPGLPERRRAQAAAARRNRGKGVEGTSRGAGKRDAIRDSRGW